MNQTIKLFNVGLRQVLKDGMLLVLLPAPFLVGMIFKLAVPVVNEILEDKLSFSLQPWYGLIDGMLVCLTPMFMAMVTAFLLLEERDENIAAFYQITPASGYPYLTARIGLPMIWALISTIIALLMFNISALMPGTIVLSTLISSLASVSLALMVVSLAENRVEGLALSKLMGLTLLGLILVWFIPAPYSYFSAFLPSFWIGKLLIDGASLHSFVIGLIACLFWIFVFTRRFLSKMG